MLTSKVLEALGHPDVEDRSKACARVISACALAGWTAGQTLTALRAYLPAKRYTHEKHMVDDIYRVRWKVFTDRAARAEAETRVAQAEQEAPPEGSDPPTPWSW